MRSEGLPPVTLVLLIAGAWLLGSPMDALAQKQRSPLKGPELEGTCDGPKVGKTLIKDLDNGDTKFKAKFTSGPPRHSFDVFWLCTTDSFGCHESSCGDIYLGSFETDANGEGVFRTILPGGNPFPGSFVHVDFYDVTPGGGGWVFTSTFGAIPAGGGGAVAGAAADASAEDPEQ